MMRQPLSMVVAMAHGGAIGLRGALPWGNIKEDMEHFKAVTKGHTVIMGRGTWLSIPAKFRPLPGRRNMVLSTTLGADGAPGAEVFRTLNAAILASRTPENADDYGSEPMIIGGAEVYQLALPLVTRIYLTDLDRTVEADTYLLLNDMLHEFSITDTHVCTEPGMSFLTMDRTAG